MEIKMLARLRKVDWTTPTASLVVVVVAFLVRLPFCLAGAGFDADSYLFLVTALASKETGSYMPSRGPGYIVPDLVGQLLAPYGWVYLNLFSNTVFAFTIPIFAAILRSTAAPYGSILLWLYALLPLNIVGFSDVMVEYSLATLGILAGWLMFARGRWVPAAFLWGAGAAMRPSQGIFLLVILLLVGWRVYGLRRALGGALAAALPLLALWVVPAYILTGDWKILTSYLPYDFALRKWLIHLTIRFVAPLGILTLLALLYFLWKHRGTVVLAIRGNAHYLLSFGVSVTTLLLFLRHPFKANYLLLGVPFVIYGLSAFPVSAVKIVSMLALLQALISVPHSPPIGTHSPVGVGVLYADLRDRLSLRREVSKLVNSAPPKSVTYTEQRTIWVMFYEQARHNLKQYNWSYSRRNRIYDAQNNRWFIAADTEKVFEEAREWHNQNYNVRVTDAVYRRFSSHIPADLRPVVVRLTTSRGI